jgi:serine/threonine protein kinase
MKSSKHTSSGGAYVASGSYACTFSPPLSCTPHAHTTKSKALKTFRNRKIGKVFEDSDDALREAEIQRIIHAVDPKNTFTVKYVGRCRISAISPQDEIGSCDKDIQNNKNMQLIYGYGGQDLWKVIGSTGKGRNTNDTFVKLFLKFEPLFRGVHRLNSIGYLHLDIKVENIVYDGNRLSLVDFGLMNTKSQMMSKSQTSHLSYDYPYYPPEFKFLAVLRTINPQTDFQKFKAFFMRNFGVITVKEESVIHKELERFFASYIFQSDRSLDGERILDKADIYSVGVTLMILYSYLVLDDDYRTYIIHDLIKDMVNCNPYERPSWEEILRRLDEIREIVVTPGAKRSSKVRSNKQQKTRKTVHADILSIKTRSGSVR